MSKKLKPFTSGMPFRTEIGPTLGKGQDNAVYDMVYPADKPHRRPSSGQVLKINHATVNDYRIRYEDNRKAAMAGLEYKKNKYDILKLFLGDFVPRSSFVLAKVTEGQKQRYAEYTVQDKVPRLSLSDLTEAQRQSPVLKQQVVELMSRLRRMYQVLGEVNARTSNGVNLDGKLDLGGVSDYVKAESLDHEFSQSDAEAIIGGNSSPNLLVNPKTMALYCVDFDQGQWMPGMDEAKNLTFELAERQNSSAEPIGNVAIGHPELPFHQFK